MSFRLGHSQLALTSWTYLLQEVHLTRCLLASAKQTGTCSLSECTGEALGVGAKHSNSLGLLE